MKRNIASPLARLGRRFARDTRGNVAIEAVILLPILFWAYLAMFSYFDMLRQQTLNEKASFTIADMLSRETDAINDTYVTNAHTLFKTMIRSDESSVLRVSVLRWNEDDDRFEVDWSEARGTSTVISDDVAAGMTDKLPTVPGGERVILVETWTTYQIPFKIGMQDFEINSFTFVRPRFAPQLPFSNAA
ncbi:MAG: TadE/TadG family type IV pilus assembly protein [Pseudooceanicola sp.]